MEKKDNIVIGERVLVSSKEDLTALISIPVILLSIIFLMVYYALMINEINYFIMIPFFLTIIIGLSLMFCYSLKNYKKKCLNKKVKVPTIVRVENSLILYNIDQSATTLNFDNIVNFVIDMPFDLFRSTKIIKKYAYGSIVFYLRSPENESEKVDFVANPYDVILKLRDIIRREPIF